MTKKSILNTLNELLNPVYLSGLSPLTTPTSGDDVFVISEGGEYTINGLGGSDLADATSANGDVSAHIFDVARFIGSGFDDTVTFRAPLPGVNIPRTTRVEGALGYDRVTFDDSNVNGLYISFDYNSEIHLVRSGIRALEYLYREDIVYTNSVEEFRGSAGNDEFYINPAFLISDLAGSIIFDGGAGRDSIILTHSETPVTLDLVNSNIYKNFENAWGSGLNDFIFGTKDHNLLSGNDGDDVIRGRAGNDRLYAGSGYDQLFGGNGDDLLFIGYADNNLIADLLDGGAGIDTLYFSTANVSNIELRLTVENYNATSKNYSGSFDFMISGGDNKGDHSRGDYFNIEAFSLTLGHDKFYGTDLANDIVNGDDGNDMLYGEDGNDRLSGGRGNDLLVGGRGADILDGNDGNDNLRGGSGRDVIVFSMGNDTVINFQDNIDTIHISSLFGATNFSQVAISQNGSNAVITIGANTLTLSNFLTANLDSSDFLFVA